MDSRIVDAVHNNARWCDAVCRSHGKPGEFLPDLWLNRFETPRFYPNAITLTARARERQVEVIRSASKKAAPTCEWGVKDSYRVLDLRADGFSVLFEAEWFHRPAQAAPQGTRSADLRVSRVRTPRDLQLWETAWSGQEQTDERVFVPALLDDEEVAVIGLQRDARLIAGAIANRSGEVAGLSNFFAREGDIDSSLSQCIAAAAFIFPSCAIVSYDSGDGAAALRRLGFDAIGPLRVWTKERRLVPSRSH